VETVDRADFHTAMYLHLIQFSVTTKFIAASDRCRPKGAGVVTGFPALRGARIVPSRTKPESATDMRTFRCRAAVAAGLPPPCRPAAGSVRRRVISAAAD